MTLISADAGGKHQVLPSTYYHQRCPDEQFVIGVGSDGTLICAPLGGLSVLCGNTNLEPGEACDDNMLPGDGCAAECDIEDPDLCTDVDRNDYHSCTDDDSTNGP